MKNPTALVSAALLVRVVVTLAALLMLPSASAQLYTTTTSNTTWVGATGRWSSGTSGPFTSTWTDYSHANFAVSGTYNFQRLIATGTANIGNVTLGPNVRVIFAQSSGQAMNLVGPTGGVATFSLAEGSQIDFASIIIAPGTNTGYIKSGAGSLTMTGGIIQGPVTLDGGNLVGRNSNAFGQGPMTINGGALGATTNLTSPTNRVGGITVAGDFQLGISGSAGNASSMANMTFSGTGNTVNLGSVRRTFTLGNSGSMTFGGAIAGSGGLTLTRDANGGGWFALSGSNTFTGGLTLDGVRVNASASNTALGAGDVFLGGVTGSNTTLNITSGVTLGNTVTFADGAGEKTLANLGSSGTLTGVVNNADSTGSTRIGAGTGRTFTLSGGLGGSGSTDWYFGGTSGTSSLVGTVLIGAANSYSGAGNTTIANSTVRLAAADGLATNNLTLSGAGTLDLGGQAQSIADLTGDATSKIQSTGDQGTLFVGNNDTSSIFGGSILGSGVNNVALQKTGTGSFELTNSDNTFTGGVVVQEGDLIVSASTLKEQAVDLQVADSSIEFKQSTSGTFSGAISGDGSLTKTGASTLTLSGSNSYSGGTTVSAGTLIGTTRSLQGAITNDAAVTIDQATDGSYAGAMSGTGSLTKSGSGALTMSGANTYAGATDVSGGALVVDGSLGNTALTVRTGSRLGGSGSIGSSGGALVAIQSGGSLAPGNSPGMLTVNGNLTMSLGSTYDYEVVSGSISADSVDINGVLSLNDTTLSLTNLGTYVVNEKFTLFAYDSLIGTFDGLADDTTFTAGGGNWLINYNDTTGGLNTAAVGTSYITLTAVPEPSALLIGALGLVGLLRRRR